MPQGGTTARGRFVSVVDMRVPSIPRVPACGRLYQREIVLDCTRHANVDTAHSRLFGEPHTRHQPARCRVLCVPPQSTQRPHLSVPASLIVPPATRRRHGRFSVKSARFSPVTNSRSSTFAGALGAFSTTQLQRTSAAARARGGGQYPFETATDARCPPATLFTLG